MLAKRSLVFGEDPSTWFTSPQAYTAYTRGMTRARHDERQPPLTAAGWAGRRRYAKDRRHAQDHVVGAPSGRRPVRLHAATATGRCGCRFPARPVISGFGCRCGGGCGRGAGCVALFWSATRRGGDGRGRRRGCDGGRRVPSPRPSRGRSAGPSAGGPRRRCPGLRCRSPYHRVAEPGPSPGYPTARPSDRYCAPYTGPAGPAPRERV